MALSNSKQALHRLRVAVDLIMPAWQASNSSQIACTGAEVLGYDHTIFLVCLACTAVLAIARVTIVAAGLLFPLLLFALLWSCLGWL
jgi:hypothetical protein